MKIAINYKNLIIILVCFFQIGCGTLTYHKRVVNETLRYFEQVREENEQKYLGKDKDIVLDSLGNPYFVKNDTEEGLYDEELSYKIYKGKGIMRTRHILRFHFKDRKVAAVSVW